MLKLPAAVNSASESAIDNKNVLVTDSFVPEMLLSGNPRGFRSPNTPSNSHHNSQKHFTAKFFSPQMNKEEHVLATDSIIPETQLPGDITGFRSGSTGHAYRIPFLSPRQHYR